MDKDNPTLPSYEGMNQNQDMSQDQDDQTQQTESPLSSPVASTPPSLLVSPQEPHLSPPAQTSLPLPELASSSVPVASLFAPLPLAAVSSSPTFASAATSSFSLTPASVPPVPTPVSESSTLQTSFTKPKGLDNLHCKACDYNFGLRTNYMRHQEEYHQLSCERCDILFDHTEAYQEHTKRVHEPSNTLACPDCQTLFPTEPSLDQHRVVHHGKESTVTHYELKIQHPTTMPDQENELNYCAACEYTFSGKNEFQLHLARTHHLDLSVPIFPLTVYYPDAPLDPNHPHIFCPRCEFTFAKDYHLQKHLELNHALIQKKKSGHRENQRTRYCTLCDREFSRNVLFMSHQRLHKYPDSEHNCKRCLLGFSSKNGFLSHARYCSHVSRLRSADAHSFKSDSLHCETCNRTLSNEISLLRHLDSDMHKKKANFQEKYPDLYRDHKDNYCKQCDLPFANRSLYQVHLLSVHQIKLPPFDLPASDVTSAAAAAAAAAISEKTSTTSRKKPATRQRASTRIRLRDEIKRDPDEFVCTACQTQFNSQTELIQHKSTFHRPDTTAPPDPDDPNLHCSVCDLAFPSTINYRQHLNEAHAMNLPIPEKRRSSRSSTLLTGKKPDFYDPDLFCAACDRTFVNGCSFRNHMFRIHKSHIEQDRSIKSVFCEICRIQYISRRKYNEHVKRKHSETQSPDSAPRGNKRKYINLDVVPTIDDPNHRCTACNYTYTTRAGYRAHLRTIHKMDLPEIPYDNKRLAQGEKQRFSTRTQSKHGEQTPQTVSENYCNICQHRYSSESNLRMHLQKLHNVPMPPRKTRASYVNLSITPDIEHPENKCTACNRTYSSKHSLRQHLIDLHQMNLPPLDSPTHDINRSVIPDIQNPRNRCTVCNRKYFSRYSFREHLKRVHGIEVPNVTKTKPTTSKGYQPRYINRAITPEIDHPRDRCTACRRKYSSKRALRQHLIVIHKMQLPPLSDVPAALPNLSVTPELENEQNKCTSCKRTYRSKHTLRRHLIDVHRLDLPLHPRPKKPVQKINCDFCTKFFFTPSLYQEHMLLEHAEEYDAHRLESSGTRSLRLRDRERIKSITTSSSSSSSEETTNEVRVTYACVVCDRTCRSKEILRKHLMQAHEIKLPETNQDAENVQERNEEKADSEGEVDEDEVDSEEINKEALSSEDPDNHCVQCDRDYATRSLFRFHLKRVHDLDLPRKSSSSTEITTGGSSSAAVVSFTDDEELSSEDERVENSPEEEAVDARIKKCNECGERFTDNLLYQLHVAQAHELPPKKRVKFNLPLVQSADSDSD